MEISHEEIQARPHHQHRYSAGVADRHCSRAQEARHRSRNGRRRRLSSGMLNPSTRRWRISNKRPSNRRADPRRPPAPTTASHLPHPPRKRKSTSIPMKSAPCSRNRWAMPEQPPSLPTQTSAAGAPTIKDQQVSFDGNVVHGQFLTADCRQRRMGHGLRPHWREGWLRHLRSHRIQSRRPERSHLSRESRAAKEIGRGTRPHEVARQCGRRESRKRRTGNAAEIKNFYSGFKLSNMVHNLSADAR